MYSTFVKSFKWRKTSFFFVLPRKDGATSLKDSYLELDFIISHRAGVHSRYADGDHIRLVNLGPIAFFIKY